MELKSLTEQKSLLATLPPGKRARLHRLLFEFGPGNGTLMLLPIDQGSSTARATSSPTRPPRTPTTSSGSPPRPDTRRSPARSGWREVLPRLRRPGAADPQGQRQDRHSAVVRLPSPPATRASRTASGSAPTRSATRSTSAPRARTRTSPSCARCAEDCDRFGMPLVIWSYPRGEFVDAKGGRQLLLRDRLRGADGDGDGRRHRQAQHAEDRLQEGQGRPRALQRDGSRPGGGDPPVRRIGRPRAGRPLRRLQDRRRDRADQHPRGDGGGRLRRDLRPQRLAARVERGAEPSSSRSRRRLLANVRRTP